MYKAKLNGLLTLLNLDQKFTKASGNLLTTDQNEKIIDFSGGYGSLIIGHNHDELIQLITSLYQQKTPVYNHLTVKESIINLSKALNQELYDKYQVNYSSIYGNSGAEAVEIAMKHSKLVFSKKLDNINNLIGKEIKKIIHHYQWDNQWKNIHHDDIEITSPQHLKSHISEYFQRKIQTTTPLFIALKKAYHGKTSGALTLTYNTKYKNTLDKSVPTIFISPDEKELSQIINEQKIVFKIPYLHGDGSIQFKERKICSVFGIFIEPIQGEGGVNIIEKSFLQSARNIATENNLPLVFDEIQCGFYRTGTFLHSFQSNVRADYYIMSKSLSGGLVKTSVVLIDEKQYDDDIDLMQTSTFADDGVSANVSLKALDIAKKLITNLPTLELLIKKLLSNLKNEYPEVIKEIRGKGLIWGLEFHNCNWSDNYSFQTLSRSGFFNYFIHSYLLNQWGVKIAPTLSNSFVLRLLPSLLTTEEEIQQLEAALTSLCKIITCRDFYKLIEHLLPVEEQNLRPLKDFGIRQIERTHNPKLEKSAGFLVHILNQDSLKKIDQSIACLKTETAESFLDRFSDFLNPTILTQQVITNSNGEQINLNICGLFFTVEMARKKLNNRDLGAYISQVEKGARLLSQDLNCDIVGLGQYTSIIAKNGTAITDININTTTGNSYTVGAGVQMLSQELQSSSLHLAVIGAGGNISSTYLKCLYNRFNKISLKGSDSQRGIAKAKQTGEELIKYIFDENIKIQRDDIISNLITKTLCFSKYQEDKNIPVFDFLKNEMKHEFPFVIATSLEDIKDADVTIVATNSPTPFLKSEHLKNNSIVYDISVPVNSTQELIHNTKGIKVIMGGIIQLPHNEHINTHSYPLKTGESFACMAETLLIAFDGFKGDYSYGKINPKQVTHIINTADKNGFEVKKTKVEVIF